MPDPPPDPLIGRVVAGRYRVIKPLGEGGMGQVYLAEHEAIEKKVALKVLRPEYSRREDIVTRFQQEAISASRIKHPNVLDVFDFGKLETGEAFLAMEFLEGHDLSDELAKVGTIDPDRGLGIALQICRALAAAHGRGVVHRDMKPDNVFLQRTGDGEEIVKIVDFGIAQLRTTEEAAKAQPTRRRLTKTGMIFGTPEYMAPEQAAGRHADLRVDVYAVGVILYEMFTGAVPFTGDSFMAVLTATLNQPPPAMRELNPDLRIGPELEAVVMRALAKHPEQRFASMAELSSALLATPEGAPFLRRSFGSIPDVGAPPPPTAPLTALPGGASPTALSAGQGTALSPGQTAVHGTPAAHATARTAASLSGQAKTVGPTSAPSPALVFLGLGIVVALGIGGYVAFSRTPPASAEVAPAVSPPPPAPAPPALETAPPPVAPAPSPAPAATVTPVTAVPTEVTLHVVTDPPGAAVTKGGYQVCAETPCDVSVTRNEGVELLAQKGTLRGAAKVLPQREQTVTIALAAPAARPKASRLCERTVMVGDVPIKQLIECDKK